MSITATNTATGGASVTPSNTVKLGKTARSLWIGGTGNVSILSPDGDTVIYVGVTGLLPAQACRVNATGTTATDITAMF